MFASVGLVVLAPVLLVLGILVRRRLGHPILFRQVRAGLGGKPFTLYKFRTMVDAMDPSGMQRPDGQRLTPFGSWLRSTSLDELPELWNVIRGEMSLVGPRPLLMDYLPRYSDHQSRRHDVRPGLTGWSQVEGRNAVTWTQRLDHDVWYVDHLSPRLDAVVLLRTVVAVISRRDVAADGHATMPMFEGDRSQAELDIAVSTPGRADAA